MKQIIGGITTADGFLAASVAAEIKYKNRKDMALVYSEVPAKIAGVFTTNRVKAAPVKRDIQIVKENELAQAVVLNSGIANACTKKEGEKSNFAMAQAAAEALNIPENYVLTASTGVIGMLLPEDKVKNGAKALVPLLSREQKAGTLAAEAIMTTDTVSKECAVQFDIQGKTITIGGMAKGSGMIHPNMATLLSVITTDAAISKALLQEAVKNDVEDSFNMISVDRDTSTNDSLLVLANGKAGNREITEKNEDYNLFCKALSIVTKTLAKKMAKDGEGATRLLEVEVIHTKTKKDAVLLSKSIITSNLVKTAIYGSDANWGRILCAMGYAGAEFNPEKVDLWIKAKENGKLKLVEEGSATDYSEDLATKILSEEEVNVLVDIKEGKYQAIAWGCDLTYNYIKINGDYRS